MDIMIETKNLAKAFRSNGSLVEAVKGINLTVGKGEIFSLLGPNGAGKTTTISMISGLTQPTRGDAFIGGTQSHTNRFKPSACSVLSRRRSLCIRH